MAIAISLVMLLLAPAATHAQRRTNYRRNTDTVAVTVRLQIVGQPAAAATTLRRTTFWVAYGPLGGRFGIFQLQPSGHGAYGATRRLPASGRSVFTYLAGQGVVRARFGPAPGDPVIIIRRLGPIAAKRLGSVVMQWRLPVG